MSTWHQDQAQKRFPRPFFHTTEWTVVIDPPNQMRTLMCFSSKNFADVYMRGLKANNPAAYGHSYILPPANRK